MKTMLDTMLGKTFEKVLEPHKMHINDILEKDVLELKMLDELNVLTALIYRIQLYSSATGFTTAMSTVLGPGMRHEQYFSAGKQRGALDAMEQVSGTKFRFATNHHIHVGTEFVKECETISNKMIAEFAPDKGLNPQASMALAGAHISAYSYIASHASNCLLFFNIPRRVIDQVFASHHHAGVRAFGFERLPSGRPETERLFH